MKSEKKSTAISKKRPPKSRRPGGPPNQVPPPDAPPAGADIQIGGLKVPAVLLEGDDPHPHVISELGPRFSLGPVSPVALLCGSEHSGGLPEAYGTGQMWLMAADPRTLHAYWDFTQSQLRELSREGVLHLRFHVNAIGNAPFLQIPLPLDSSHWSSGSARGGMKYVAELGYFKSPGLWVSVSASPPTVTPSDLPAAEIDRPETNPPEPQVAEVGQSPKASTVRFASIPFEIPLPVMLSELPPKLRAEVPLLEAIQQLGSWPVSVQSHPLPRETPVAPTVSTSKGGISNPVHPVQRPWIMSFESERATASLATRAATRSACERGERILVSSELGRPSGPQVSPEAVEREAAGWSAVAPEAAGLKAVEKIAAGPGVTSPAEGLAKPSERKGFWFTVHADLVVYGATEPDAQVSLGELPIELMPDGTFGIRLTLPDGSFELPAIAVSSDGKEKRGQERKINRSTHYEGFEARPG
ncbi:MAG: DUF4912 domain-containing protein [Candidatus Omnitrophica bacterium]|nr:DUF4912 domain-containing protein [Candidatus Omnitrophota bacterium]